MAKKEEPVVDNETGKIKVKAKKEQQPTGNETKGNVTKVKAKMKAKPKVVEETITKVNLDKPIKPEENEIKEDNTNNEGVVTELKDADTPQKQEEVQSETETQETPILEEVTDSTNEEKIEEKVEQVEEIAAEAEEAIKENLETGKPLPENIQKLVNFMEETGGDLNDYVKLNKDYSELDNQDLLYEYYNQTKPHLNAEEINFLMEDQFSYDEDTDDEKEIRRKKLAMKEQVAQARQHLDSVKSKYYEDIKGGSKLTKEQQKAIDFFNRYNEKSENDKKILERNTSTFLKKTDNIFNDKFKGFEFNVGDKKYRFNVNDVDSVKKAQSDINNFVGKFLDKNNVMDDAAGYHKSLYTAMNPDAVAKHFYEQGKADALKESVAKSKNISMDPRQELGSNIVNQGGIKVRALGDSTEDFKFKIKNNKFKN